MTRTLRPEQFTKVSVTTLEWISPHRFHCDEAVPQALLLSGDSLKRQPFVPLPLRTVRPDQFHSIRNAQPALRAGGDQLPRYSNVLICTLMCLVRTRAVSKRKPVPCSYRVKMTFTLFPVTLHATFVLVRSVQ
jgi:hypothetical protein